MSKNIHLNDLFSKSKIKNVKYSPDGQMSHVVFCWVEATVAQESITELNS